MESDGGFDLWLVEKFCRLQWRKCSRVGLSMMYEVLFPYSLVG